MIKNIRWISDVGGSNYIGVKFDQSEISQYLNKLKSYLGEDDYITYTTYQSNRDRNTYHMTIINVMDCGALSKKMEMKGFVDSVDKIMNEYPIDDIKLIGVGSNSKNENKSYYIVAESDKIQSIRQRFGLSKIELHITIGFKHRDVFGVKKDESTLISEKSEFLREFKKLYDNDIHLNFIYDIKNFDGGDDIKVIDINPTHISILSGGKISVIGLIDNELRVTNEYGAGDEEESKSLSNYEIKEKIKE